MPIASRQFHRILHGAALALLVAVTGLGVGGTPAHADKLLEETTELTGTIMYLESKVPGLVIGVIRNGETSVHGFGKIADGSDKEPDGDTLMRIGSITKVFCGATLASMVADGTVSFTDRLQDRLGWDVKIPERDGKQIRLIDLATQASGLPREAEGKPGEDATAERSKEDYVASLTGPDVLLFAPGTGVLYSNFGFDMLAQALANAGGKPYPALLKERVLDPAGLKDTRFDLSDADKSRTMQGHNFDGSPMPFVPTSPLDRRRWWTLLDGERHAAMARLASRPLLDQGRRDAPPRPSRLSRPRRTQPGVRLGRRRHDGCHGARLGGDAAGGAQAADHA